MTTAKKFKCPECSKEFDTPNALGPHRAKAHGYAVKPPSKNPGANHPAANKLAGSFPCTLCAFVASWKGGLTKHVNAAHPNGVVLPPRPSGPPFTCPECGLTFQKFTGLGIHRRFAHEVPGSSKTSITERLKKERGGEIVKATKNAEVTHPNAVHPNGHLQVQDDGAHRLEAIATLACGRIQQVIEGLAFTHDLPPRSLTALVIRTLGQAAKVW